MPLIEYHAMHESRDRIAGWREILSGGLGAGSIGELWFWGTFQAESDELGLKKGA
jgi:hypothetical protein